MEKFPNTLVDTHTSHPSLGGSAGRRRPSPTPTDGSVVGNGRPPGARANCTVHALCTAESAVLSVYIL